MGIQDQFKDKAKRLAEKSDKARQARDEASERASKGRDLSEEETRRAQQEAQDKVDQDYEI
ncbi:hypothetical protein [Streptomyces sp. NPDC056144]|uniref:hypothetical protein n=1 Tax=unclassified Streptomyces TaxID=2593676 RepID=UPI0035D550D7